MDNDNDFVVDLPDVDFDTIGNDDDIQLTGDDTGGQQESTTPDNIVDTPENNGDNNIAEDIIDNDDLTNDDTDDDDDDPELSGIERYLSKFGVQAGMINTPEGTFHFNDLSPEKQEKALNYLFDAKQVDPTEGLDPSDAELIKALYENKQNLATFIDNEVNARTQQYQELQAIQNLNVTDMSDEDVFKAMLLADADKEMTPEQIEQSVADAKALPNFSDLAKVMRTQLANSREAVNRQLQQEQYEKQQALINDYRMEVIDSVADIDTLFDVRVDDNLKNRTLDRILSFDERGFSDFQKEIMNDPQKLFRAAFLYDNAEALLQGRDEFWKRQTSIARKKWEASAAPKTNKKSFTSKNNNSQTKTNPQVRSQYFTSQDDDLDVIELTD